MKYYSLQQQWVLFLIALLMLGILYFKFYVHPLPPSSEESIKEFVVEVSGEVRNPGVYIFQNPPRLIEAIERAGGLKEKAKFDATASSETLETGTLITIQKLTPSPLEEKGEGKIIKIKMDRMAANKLLVFSIPLDLNRASVEDLCLIPGIGESLAQEIDAYRARRRGFRSVEELKEVKGIGEKKWKELKNYFAVRED